MAEDPTERSVERLVQAFCALELPPEWELLGVRPQRAEPMHIASGGALPRLAPRGWNPRK